MTGRRRRRRAGARVAVLAAAALALAACGGGDNDDDAGPPAPRVVDAYAAPASGDVGAAYLVLANDGGRDHLTGASSPLAGRVELHRTERRGGLDVMVHADALELPAHGELRLEPTGDHLMLVALGAALVPGDTVPLELTFRRSAPVVVEAPVLSYDDIDARRGGPT